ncbi:MAG: glycosyl hydrolase family 17 protein, partial [Bacteroidota bacterium]
ELSLAGANLADKTPAEIKDLFLQTLENGMHGICFSAYEEGQQPGDILTEDQVEKRMKILAPYTKWVRSFSCIEGNELIPKVAKKYGLKTLVGAWLGKEADKNEEEIAALIQLAKEGLVDIAAVGNEVLYREEMEAEELIHYIQQVKTALPDVPVGYVDAYYKFVNFPQVSDACDVILSNCYPYWEGCPLEYSLLYMKEMYRQAQQAGKGKKVIVTETGWPSQGSSLKGSHPSEINAMKYFINSQKWSQEEDIELFYFTSFDESWKVGSEGDVGAYWGIWDKDEAVKY